MSSLSLEKFCVKHKIATLLNTFRLARTESRFICLMYHDIHNRRETGSDLYSIPLDKFRRQMQLLKRRADLDLTSFSKAGGMDGVQSEQIQVGITFDDGHLSNYTLAYPFLKESEIAFTVFMISDFIHPDFKEYLGKEQLRELAQDPLAEIGAHGKTHRPLTDIPLKEAIEEMRVSKLEIQDVIGKSVDTMSFPHGKFNESILNAARELGYRKCGTSVARSNPLKGVSGQVNRHCIFNLESDLSFEQKIDGKWDWLERSSQ